MTRMLPIFLLASLGAGCTFAPPGECQTAADCFVGARCETGVCVMGCDADEHCAGDWEQCEPSARRCTIREGRCSSQAQCETWEVCGDGHTCETAPNFCATETDCADHADCNLSTHLCQLQTGRCDTLEDCENGSTPWASCNNAHSCTYAPTDDVMMWGTLDEGRCGRDALSPVEFPERARVGFGCFTGSLDPDAVLTPAGEVLYIDRDTNTNSDPILRAFSADPFMWLADTKVWLYPEDPYLNDRAIPTPGCAPDDIAWSFVVQAGTSRVLYSCRATPRDWYDTSGEHVLTIISANEVRAWNKDGLFLTDRVFTWDVLDPQGIATPVTGLPPHDAMLDVRADGSGFWLVLKRSSEDNPERWRVTPSGVATLQVVYSGLPAGVTDGTGFSGVLSKSGALYQLNGRTVVRRSADGSTAAVVYDEADKPEGANDFKAPTLLLYNTVLRLFAGP